MVKKTNVLVGLLVVAAFIVLLLAAGLCWIRRRHNRFKGRGSSSSGAAEENPDLQSSSHQLALINQPDQRRGQGTNETLSVPYHVFRRNGDPPLMKEHPSISGNHDDAGYSKVPPSNVAGVFPMNPTLGQHQIEPETFDLGMASNTALPRIAPSPSSQSLPLSPPVGSRTDHPYTMRSIAQSTAPDHKYGSNAPLHAKLSTSQLDNSSSLSVNSPYNPTGLDFGLESNVGTSSLRPLRPRGRDTKQRLEENTLSTHTRPYNNNDIVGSSSRLKNDSAAASARKTERSRHQIPLSFETPRLDQPSRSISNYSSLSYLKPEPLCIRKINSSALPTTLPQRSTNHDGIRGGYRSEAIDSRETASPGVGSSKTFHDSRYTQQTRYDDILPEHCEQPFTIDRSHSMEFPGQDQENPQNPGKYARLPTSDNLEKQPGENRHNKGKSKGKTMLPVESILSQPFYNNISQPPTQYEPVHNRNYPDHSYISNYTYPVKPQHSAEEELQGLPSSYHTIPYDQVKTANAQTSDYRYLDAGASIPQAEKGDICAVKADSEGGNGTNKTKGATGAIDTGEGKKMRRLRMPGAFSWVRRHV